MARAERQTTDRKVDHYVWDVIGRSKGRYMSDHSNLIPRELYDTVVTTRNVLSVLKQLDRLRASKAKDCGMAFYRGNENPNLVLLMQILNNRRGCPSVEQREFQFLTDVATTIGWHDLTKTVEAQCQRKH